MFNSTKIVYLEEILTLKRMENKYNYFKRDISWLSFNYRVLLEARDEHLPLYERINFISIYSANLEEFYKIRVADHKAVASGATESDEESVQSARELVEEINREVNRQLDDRVRIYEQNRPGSYLLPVCFLFSPVVFLFCIYRFSGSTGAGTKR